LVPALLQSCLVALCRSPVILRFCCLIDAWVDAYSTDHLLRFRCAIGSGRLISSYEVLRLCLVAGCTQCLLFIVAFQQIACVVPATPAISCHAKSCLNRDDCCCYRVVGLLIPLLLRVVWEVSPVLLALQSMPCCDRCLLTVNLFWSIASASVLDAFS
jgi:hypothetical protein